ncbi:MAG: FHA domain-containing protein, partial [Gammaproteobacteria bacterium]|nr:FHA domain-containing protein [Gammaproteobacteria bacterium]
AQLQSELSDALEALGCVEDELATTHRIADELRQQVETREAEVGQITAAASELEAVVDAHDQEVAVLQLRIDELESEQLAIADRLTQFDSLEAYANDCDLQIRALQSQLEVERQRRAPHTDDTHKSIKHTSTGTKSNADETTMVEHLGPVHVPIRTIEVFRGKTLDQILRVSGGQKRIMIGRDSDNELVLDSNFISRHHAILSFRDDGSASIEDLHSTNGVVVNKTKLTSSELAVGDVVILGDFYLLPGPA